MVELEIRLLEGERKSPDIIGLSPQVIAKLTLEEVKREFCKYIDSGRQKYTYAEIEPLKFYLFMFDNSFIPPTTDVVNSISQILLTMFLHKKIGRGKKAFWAKNNSFGVGIEPEIEESDKEFVDSPPSSFLIRSGDQWSKAWKICQRIKNTDVSKKSFLVDPNSIYISLDSKIGEGAVIYPYSFVISSEVGNRSVVGAGSHIINSKISDEVTIFPYCYIEGAELESGVSVGPFCRMRPRVIVRKGAKIGNFAEIKNSEIGEETKVQHFSYIGDARIGKNVNIGAGTVTCNFDGEKKNETFIGDGAFIGSGSMLIAPLKVEEFAYIGAGSSINKDVPPYALAIERAEIKIISGWRKKKKF